MRRSMISGGGRWCRRVKRVFSGMLDLIDVRVRTADQWPPAQSAGHAAGDRRQPSVRHRRRHRSPVAGRAAGPTVPGHDPQGPAQDPRDGALLAADRLFRDQGRAEEQHGGAPRSSAAAERGRHHCGVSGRRRRHRAEGLWQGARPAVEDVSGTSRAGGQGVSHSDPFLRAERPAVPPGQRPDEHGRA